MAKEWRRRCAVRISLAGVCTVDVKSYVLHKNWWHTFPNRQGKWDKDYLRYEIMLVSDITTTQSLQCIHKSVMASQFTSNLIVCHTVCWSYIKAQHYSSFEENPYSPVDSTHKGPVIDDVENVFIVMTLSWNRGHPTDTRWDNGRR